MLINWAFDVATSKTKLLMFIVLYHTSVLCSMSGVNNAHLFVVASTDTFPGIKSFTKRHKPPNNVPTLLQLFLKDEIEFVLVAAAACWNFLTGLSRDCFCFYFHG